MKHIIKPLLGNGKKVLANGADVLAKNGKNGLNGNGNELARSYAKKQRALAKANTSTSVQEEVFVEPTVKPVDDAVDNHLSRRRDTVDVAMPLDELETTLIKSLEEVGVTGVNLTQPIRRAGPLGDATTLYRNYGQAWQQSGRAQKESLYAELDGERFFTDVKDKKTGRLAIRNVRDKLDESVRTGSARDIAIAEQTYNEADLRTWHRTLKTQRGWEAHHLNMIKLISNIVNGMDLNGRTAIYRHLGRRYNLFTGNSVFNKINLPPDIHDFVHAEMDRIGINYRKINFDKNTPLKTRLKYIKQYAKKMDQLQEYIYKQMSQRPSVASRLN